MRNMVGVRAVGWLLLIGIPQTDYAQPSQLRFEHLTVKQGLSNHIVYAMLQDKQGYLWFATDNGLNKYDGYTLTTYKKTPGDTTSLVGNSMPQLMEDREGYIWIGTMGQGLCKFNRHTEKFTCYAPNPPTMNKGATHTLSEDREGYLWVSNGRAELRRFDKKTGQYAHVNYAALLAPKPAGRTAISPVINHIYTDKTGTVWVGSEKGLHRMNLKPTAGGRTARISFTTYHHDPANGHSLPHDQVWEVYEDHAGRLWVSNGSGLSQFDRKTETFTQYPYSLSPSPVAQTPLSQKLTHIAEDQLGNLWMRAVVEGLVRFDPVRRQFTHLPHNPVDPSSLSSNLVRSLLVDRSGLLWVGTYGEGIDMANPGQQPFRHYRPFPYDSRSLSNEFVRAILEDRSGTVWIGTGNGLNRMDKRTGTFTQYRHDPRNPASLPALDVEALLEDRAGNLWVGSGGKLGLFNRQTGTFTNFPQVTRRNRGLTGVDAIFTLYQDRQGLLWLGTTNGVKSFDQQSGTVVHYAYDPENTKGISDAWAMSLLEDKRGNLWIGTGSVALNCLDRQTGRFRHYRPDRHRPGSLTADAVSCIFEDTKGNLWFGTAGGGLCRFDHETETFQSFTEADGLADNSVYSILEDNRGYLWLGTSKGLSRFSFATKTFSNYDVNDGLQSKGFGEAHFKGKDGVLYVGGDNGFTAFDPRHLTTNWRIPPVVITQVKLFDKPMTGKGEAATIELDYDQNFLSFEFAALNYNNPSKNRYAYQLAGLEKDWVYSGSRRYASYTNLDPGTYVFRVKGSNNDGVWNEKGASIQVVIHPPWWQTTWFRLIAMLGLLGLAGLSVRLYTRTRLRRQRQDMKRVLEAQEEERQRLAADLHDDLGATLAVIKMQLQTIHQPGDSLATPIGLMKRAIRDLRHISHNLMPPEFAHLGLTEAIQETVRRAEAGSDLHFLFITYGQERRLDHETELTIYRIAVELINNAMKHARARQITIQLIFYPQYVSLLVEDDGRGYPVSAQSGQAGIGLRNIRSRVAYLQSKLIVDSGEAGTTVTLDVPF